jgi:anti-sigma regulatory factor (Ser/Thr protein kinase)
LSLLRATHRTVVVYDQFPDACPTFYGHLGRCGQVQVREALSGDPIVVSDGDPHPVVLLDVRTLMQYPVDEVRAFLASHRQAAMGLITELALEDYITYLRGWNILQVGLKKDTASVDHIRLFLDCVTNPASGFGLSRYLFQTSEIYTVSARTLDEKNRAIEQIINYFATTGFEIHQLYHVRLILEETLNNAFFHAFRTADSKEKYSIREFTCLEDNEAIVIEYGNCGEVSGFTVTDPAGTLPPEMVLRKLERQYNRDGMMDEGGRGLYLARVLSAHFVVNIDPGRRTQIIALFQSGKEVAEPKPFMVNCVRSLQQDLWNEDPDFD